FAVHAVAEVIVAAPNAPIESSLLDVASLGGCEHSVRVLGAFRDDVDNAVYGIGPPDGASGTGDHLDTVDILNHHVLHVPVHAAEERRVDRTPIYEYQYRLA